VEGLVDVLESHRRRIRVRRALASAARWAFYSALAGSGAIFAAKFLGIPVPGALVAGLCGALPLGVALRDLTRSFTLLDCAVHLDRRLGLEERLATAVEGAGALGPAVEADAGRALEGARFPARRILVEERLLVPALIVAAALAWLPARERAGSTDAAGEAALSAEALKLERLAGAEIRFREAADLLAQGRPEEALEVLRSLREMLERKLLESGGGAGTETLRLQADQAAASAAAVAAELARLGRTVHAPPPVVAEAKLSRRRELAAAEAPPDGAPSPAAARAVLLLQDWEPRYDPVIRRYFRSGP
jgi:hypothetical protein